MPMVCVKPKAPAKEPANAPAKTPTPTRSESGHFLLQNFGGKALYKVASLTGCLRMLQWQEVRVLRALSRRQCHSLGPGTVSTTLSVVGR